MKMLPCPFCEGPPKLTLHECIARNTVCRPYVPPEEGEMIEGVVFCHECGASGPVIDNLIFEDSELDSLSCDAAIAWNRRDGRHRGLYEGGEAQGLNEFPRNEAKL